MATKSDNVLDELFQDSKKEVSLDKPAEQKGFLTAQEWLNKRESEINRILSTLLPTKQMTVGDPTANLSKMHEVITSVREHQAFVLTYLAKAIEMELEVKRALAVVISKCKDEMSIAFTTHKAIVDGARSFEEKELRLRPYLPILKDRESWESTLENIKLLKEAVTLVYDDLSKAVMSLSLQGQVLKNQILIGEVRIVSGQLLKVLQDSSLEMVEKAKETFIPRGTSEI